MEEALPQDEVWPAGPHTLAKVEIVREYLKAWFAILSHAGYSRLLYIDGFSGPGEYSTGEKGSPIVALETALSHRANLGSTELVFIFIDRDPARMKHLQGLLGGYELPGNIRYSCHTSEFSVVFGKLMKHMGSPGSRLAPTFLFIDPFGVSGIHHDHIRQLMSHETCEFLITFMFEHIARFSMTTEFAAHLDNLYGTPDWRLCLSLDQEDRRWALLSLFESQLKKTSKYIWSFRMVDQRNKDLYFLFFGTNHIRGLEKMKDAMWKVQPSGDYRFSDRNAGQVYLFEGTPDPAALGRHLAKEFAGRKGVRFEEVVEFVLVRTNFRSAHVRPALKDLEVQGRIGGFAGRNRASTYPAGTTMTFAE